MEFGLLKGKNFILTGFFHTIANYEKKTFLLNSVLSLSISFIQIISIKKIIMLFLILFPFFFHLYAQSEKENWILIEVNNENKIYLNSVGIDVFKGEDIYVWVLEENDPPIMIEGINTKIYKTKTYYLLNKDLKRYSIIQVIYFDSKNNVIKSYSYDRETDNPDFKYSSPILIDSTVEKILIKCNEVINTVRN
jgi:hypothetical protein